jgi:hypothetical protein
VPPFRKILRVSRWIAFSCFCIASLWLWWEYADLSNKGVTRAEAVDEYKKGNFMESYKLYRDATAYQKGSDSLVVALREQATALAMARHEDAINGETASREYVHLQIEAYRIADSLGLDSLKAEAALSAVNMRTHCREKGYDCAPHNQANGSDTEGGDLFNAKLAVPLGFILIVFAAIGIVLLVYPMPQSTS